MPTAETYVTYHRQTYPFIDPTQPRLSCAGKNVLVTGGGYGIGKGIARSFAKAKSTNLFLVGRTGSILEQTKATLEAEFPGVRVHVLPADITNEVAVNDLFAKATADFGPIDVLVNNAAFLPAVSGLKDATLTDWWRDQVRGRNGVVININTSVAHYGVFPTYSSYTASKMAALRMTECFQAEHPEDVRFVSLQPGGVDTEMYAKFHMPDDYPMTDIDLPSDTCVWLASGEADFLAGRFVWTNWDAEELIKRKETIIKEKELQSMLKPIEGDLF
ncbi:hypothetical protein PG994_014133 [Apiospora phragmitis]|uniref:Uncharacterized protein n=1 Tax=Apiospora phragmitis TaxID=2905665 RepID=A0ABR1T3G9_9PEZI